MSTTASVLLVATFAGILIGVCAVVVLKVQVPLGSSAASGLFRSGAVYPYNTIRSLHAKYLLPWVATPVLPASARSTLALARVGFFIAVVSLASLIAVGVASAQA